MERVEPGVYLIAETKLDQAPLTEYLEQIGAPEWDSPDCTDGEKLVEFMGRQCYRSFAPGLNKNITKVREGNDTYLENVLSVGHGCYDIETEVLTADGWKAWPDVVMSDRLATRTTEGELEYHKPSRLVHYTHKGRMYRVEGRGVDLLVTPDHKMLACVTTTREGRKKQKFDLITAEDLGDRAHAYIKTATWAGENKTNVTEKVAAMLGFAVGDGHMPERGRDLAFRLRRERKIAWLLARCHSLKWTIQNTDDRYRITIPEHYLDLFHSIYDEEGEKQIPQGLLTSLDEKALYGLYEGLMQSDGHKARTVQSFDSTSPHLPGQVQQLALHLGIAANVCYVLEDREGSYGDKPLTRLTLIRRELKPEVNKFSGHVGKTRWIEDWEGDVFCAEVPNNTLYVRRNGKPVWSGNSILEHVQLSFVFHNVSRVFTHELVRHRVGVAISQESLRYVRLDNLRMWFPPCIADDPEAERRASLLVEELEAFQLWLAEHYGIDEMTNFNKKKKLTSAFRRFAPIGLATSIGWSSNIRSLRWLGQLRTAKSAEVEIRMVFDRVMQLLVEKYPNFFGDFERVPDKKGPLAEWITPNGKV